MRPPGHRHASRGFPLAGGRVIQFGSRGVNRVVTGIETEVSAGDQNLAIREQRRGVVHAGRRRAAGDSPLAGGRIVEFGAGEKVFGKILATCDQYLAILKQRGSVGKTWRIQCAGGGPGARSSGES
jgi:hypothetical protein